MISSKEQEEVQSHRSLIRSKRRRRSSWSAPAPMHHKLQSLETSYFTFFLSFGSSFLDLSSVLVRSFSLAPWADLTSSLCQIMAADDTEERCSSDSFTTFHPYYNKPAQEPYLQHEATLKTDRSSSPVQQHSAHRRLQTSDVKAESVQLIYSTQPRPTFASSKSTEALNTKHSCLFVLVVSIRWVVS